MSKIPFFDSEFFQQEYDRLHPWIYFRDKMPEHEDNFCHTALLIAGTIVPQDDGQVTIWENIDPLLLLEDKAEASCMVPDYYNYQFGGDNSREWEITHWKEILTQVETLPPPSEPTEDFELDDWDTVFI